MDNRELNQLVSRYENAKKEGDYKTAIELNQQYYEILFKEYTRGLSIWKSMEKKPNLKSLIDKLNISIKKIKNDLGFLESEGQYIMTCLVNKSCGGNK